MKTDLAEDELKIEIAETKETMKKYNILFLCTHNSSRSILGEALASTHPSGLFQGYSAGSSPGTDVNPFARELTIEMGYEQSKLRSKSWDEFAQYGGINMDFIITVCDQAAGEQCPYWPGNPATAHWGFEDPSKVVGTDAVKRQAFRDVMVGLKKRIDILASMPLESLNSLSLRDIHRKA